MQGMKEVAIVMASTGMVAVLLTVFFDWRRKLLNQIRGFHKEGSS